MLIGIGATAYHQQNTLARLLGSAELFAPLTHSAIPTRGSLTPSFVRATTETGQKWDDNGYLDFVGLAGEIVFKGARRERNLLSNTGWLGGTSGTLGSGGVAPTGWTALGGTGSLTFADSALYSGSKSIRFQATAQRPYIQLSVAVAANSVYMAQATVEAATTSNLLSNLLAIAPQPAGATTVFIKNGTIVDGATTSASAGDSIGICMTTAATAGTSDFRFGLGAAGSPTGDVTLVAPMIANITGETDQTTIRPYVSVGVASAPAYHGSMVDGVKCYDTDRSGNPISTSGSYPIVGYVPWEARTNLGLQGNAFTTTWADSVPSAAPTQNSTGPDGATSAWTLTDASAIASNYVSQDVVLTAATYTRSIFIKKTVGAQASYPVLLSYLAATTGLAGVTIDTTKGIATAWTAYTGFTGVNGTASCVSHNDDFWRVSLTFTGTAAAWTHRMYPAGTANATQSTGTLDLTAQGSAVFYGAQVELGSFATPYIPTTTVAVARNANLLTYTGADVANIKTLACTFSRGVGPNGGVCCALSDGTLNQRAQIGVGATDVTFYGDSSGVKWNQTASNAYTIGTTAKVAFSMATNDIKMDFNGTAQTPDTVATLPTVTQLNVGNVAGVGVFNGPVNHIYGFTRNLSQSELGAIDA